MHVANGCRSENYLLCARNGRRRNKNRKKKSESILKSPANNKTARLMSLAELTEVCVCVCVCLSFGALPSKFGLSDTHHSLIRRTPLEWVETEN